MFCRKCGTQIEEGCTFCTQCGTPLSGGSNVPRGRGAKRGMKKAPIVLAVSGAVVVVLGAVVALNFTAAKNAAMKLFSSSEKYFAHVVESNSNDFAGGITGYIDVAKEAFLSGTGSEVEMKLEKGDGVEYFLDDMGVGEASQYLDLFKNIALSVDVNSKDQISEAAMGLKINDVDFGSINTIVDLGEMMLYMGLPDYNSVYLGGEMDMGYSDYEESMYMIESMMNAMPDGKRVEKIVTTYMNVMANSVNKVKEKKTTIDANGMSQKVTKLSVDIDGELVKSVGINLLETLKEDEELVQMIEEIAAVAEADMDEYFEGLDQAIESLDSMDEEELDTESTLALYVDSKGKIVGFTFETPEGDINMYEVRKGNKFATFMELDSSIVASIEGSGKISGNKRTGNFTVQALGYDLVNISVKDLNEDKLNEGLLVGTISIKPGDGVENLKKLDEIEYYVDSEVLELLPSLGLTITSEQKSIEECNCSVSVEYDDAMAIKLSMKSEQHSPEMSGVPNDYIDVEDYRKMEGWIRGFDFGTLIQNMRDAGFPSEWVDMFEGSVGQML